TRAWSVSIFSFSPTPLSSSRILLRRGRGSLLLFLSLFLFRFPRLLGALLLVVVDHSFSHPALADTGDHVLEALVDLRIVDEAADRAHSLVHLAGDRLQILRRLVEVVQDPLRGGVVAQHSSRHPLSRLDLRRHRLEVLRGGDEIVLRLRAFYSAGEHLGEGGRP